MLHSVLKLFRARKPEQPTAPTAASAPKPAADKPRKDRRKLKRATRRAAPGARKIDANSPWLEQARGAKNGR